MAGAGAIVFFVDCPTRLMCNAGLAVSFAVPVAFA
jgi:hypothetical protein